MFTHNIKTILEELNEILLNVSENEINDVMQAILKADRIFVTGAGRSLLMVRGFAMRLMQTGFTSYVVGETVTPAICKDDLLIIASGSGETGTLKVIAANAKKAEASVALITSNPASTIAKLSDYIIHIQTSTPKLDKDTSKKTSVQPGASSFEQSVLLLCDTIVFDLGSTKSIEERNNNIMRLHANLE